MFLLCIHSTSPYVSDCTTPYSGLKMPLLSFEVFVDKWLARLRTCANITDKHQIWRGRLENIIAAADKIK
jgi:hypothetical protein